MLIVFNRLIFIEKFLWRDIDFFGENYVKKQSSVVYFFNYIFGEFLDGFLVDCDIEGCGGFFCQGWLGLQVFILGRDRQYQKYIMKIRGSRL